jgi:hypothetical protein
MSPSKARLRRFGESRQRGASRRFRTGRTNASDRQSFLNCETLRSRVVTASDDMSTRAAWLFLELADVFFVLSTESQGF